MPPALLYESGKLLEGAILLALSYLGFNAEPYRDAPSEFDVVCSSAEGRFLGEAEGKDTKAINIDKMSQLERNLQEDFARDEVSEFAKGVLFGNAFRFERHRDAATSSPQSAWVSRSVLASLWSGLRICFR